MNPNQILIILLLISLSTMATRFLPFLFFPEHKKTPDFILYLGKILPLTIAGMLVVYSLKDISFFKAPHGIPEILSVFVIIILHLTKKNTLLSIGAGTLFYMFLVQVVF